MVRHIGVCGSFGFGNAGDEAIPLALERLKLDLGLAVRFSYFSRYRTVQFGGSRPLQDLEAAATGSGELDEVWYVGGGVVESGGKSVLERCGSLVSGIPQKLVCANASGSGFWRSRPQRRLLERCDAVSARDQISQAVLRDDYRVSGPTVVGDLALWLPSRECSDRLRALDSPAYAVCNFCPRWSDSPGFYDWAAMVVQAVHRHTGCPVVLVPMSEAYDSDTDVHRRIVDRLGPSADGWVEVLAGVNSPAEIAAIVRASKVLVGMRLHACVFAFSGGVPFVGIEYSRKLRGFAETVGVGAMVRPGSYEDHGVLRFDAACVDDDVILEALDRAARSSSKEAAQAFTERVGDEIESLIRAA